MTKRKEVYKPVPHLTASTSVRVRFNDCDPLGIVWHGNYIQYFEDGREDFGRSHGISYLEVFDRGFSTPIIESSCQHKRPLKYGDVARVETRFLDTPAAKLVFEYEIFDNENQLCCTGRTIQVFLDTSGELQLTLPDFFREWKRANGLES